MRRWIERQRYLIDFTVASLLRRRVRNLLLFAVYAVVIFALASVMLFSHAIRREAAALLAGAPEVMVQRLVMGRHDLVPASYLETLRGFRGVQGAEGRLWGYLYDPTCGANYTLMVPSGPDRELELASGEAIIGRGVSRARGVAAGESLLLRSPAGEFLKLHVNDVFAYGSEIVSADLVLVTEADFRRFFGLPEGVYTDLALTVANPREINTIIEKAVRTMLDARFITRRDVLSTYEAIFSWREGLLLALLGASIMAFAIFAFDKASGLSADERREIGILKAVGWETGDVLAMKLWEGALISLGAFIVGFLAAYAHVFLFAAGLLEPVLKGWAVIFPRFALVPHVDGLQVATLALFTVVPYSAATMVPIWRAAITDPDTVMR